jgi:hypothetical protein
MPQSEGWRLHQRCMVQRGGPAVRHVEARQGSLKAATTCDHNRRFWLRSC